MLDEAWGSLFATEVKSYLAQQIGPDHQSH